MALRRLAETGLNSRRFIHRTAAIRSHFPAAFLSLPVGDQLREQLRLVNRAGDDQEQRLQLSGLEHRPLLATCGVSVEEARKMLRLCQMEKLKATLRDIPATSIPFSEFAQICARECGNEDQGSQFAQTLDSSGDVIVLRDIVFLKPHQVAKSMESIISQSIADPNDQRQNMLAEMEKHKSIIDEKARAQVRAELYCGLGFLTAQTIGFMRLTFWELSWDVMEPICFFTTSLYFGMAYAFFLRTSIEPSFQGYFWKRFEAKQKKLMKSHGFDLDKYNELCRVLNHPNCGNMMERNKMWESF